jgi:excisionase family DNA binding protein
MLPSLAPLEERAWPTRLRPAMHTRRWLSQAETADYLGVTIRKIRRYISIGLLPASRIKGSRLIRIDRTDVDALLRPIPAARSWRGGLEGGEFSKISDL